MRVDLVSLGTRGLVTGLETGDVQAGLVAEPNVSRLVNDNGAVVLADLRSPEAVARTLGSPTVNAGVFGRSDRMPRDADLAAFGRAVLAAERLIADTSAEDLAGRWPARPIRAPHQVSPRLHTTPENLFAERRHDRLGHDRRRGLAPTGGIDDADARDDLVASAAQAAEHGSRIIMARRLAQRLAVDDDDRVGAQHHALGHPAGDGTRLPERQRGDRG